MEKIIKKKRIWFFISLLASILFVVGIPLIPVFVGKNWAIAIMGIVFVVFGFYSMPFFWLKYSSFFGLKRVLEAITYEHIYSVKDIAIQLQKTEQDVKNIIIKLINKRYLVGYLFDGFDLKLNNNVKAQKKLDVNVCSNCGARITVEEHKTHCEYCGAIYSVSNKK